MKQITFKYTALLALLFFIGIKPITAQNTKETTSNTTAMHAHYKIYDVQKKQVIQLDDLVQAVKPIDVLFFGEEHNDSTAHHLQLEIYKRLITTYGSKLALSLEMFHTDVQVIMNEYLSGIISDRNFQKEARAWNNYKDYKPLVELAKKEKLPVISANASSRYTNTVTREGLESLLKLSDDSKKFLPPLPIDTATGAYHKKFNDLLGGHMGSMKVYQSQSLWDATMAWSMANFMKKNKGFKVYHLNGRFHSDEKLGTYDQLKNYAPRLKASNISCFPAEDFSQPNWEKYSHLGDFIILTDPTVKKTF